MNDDKKVGLFALKFFIYILGIFQAALYTPVILSGILFVAIISVFFKNGLISPLLIFFHNGYYKSADIMAIYGGYAFGASLTVTFVEMVTRKQFKISIRKKAVLLGTLLLIGYSFVFVFFIKVGLSVGEIAIILVPLFILSVLSVFLRMCLEFLTNFLNKILVTHKNNR